ncbi:hypothetical protein CEUSTIGMA_g5803.t1 [Chlamydomonas eustigma]|uniref:Glutathione transferase n=1 Tax=Chlamydomonas eustigma TaxID=1157962 RepID=A0A250X5K6_9CHLO|nr:hypothetical protein CEUSTIGMA_g5803.t1 [Chlamydomonas eustigma]|eukprot:GAX78361.1 hypothetical protein CEUSTIGMA_g5803.t1 [Chlamydomonas eustigma]
MPLKLYYLPLRARAEATRLVLNYGGIPYEDVSVEFGKWPELKADAAICPLGQLPSLEMNDGTVICQSGAILRYAARLANLIPSSPEGLAEAEMIQEITQEMNDINPIVCYFDYQSDVYKSKHDAYFNALPKWLSVAQRVLGDHPFFGRGTGPSFADFALFHIVDMTLLVQPKALDEYSKLMAWFKSIQALPAVKAYLEKRPAKGVAGSGKPGSLMAMP